MSIRRMLNSRWGLWIAKIQRTTKKELIPQLSSSSAEVISFFWLSNDRRARKYEGDTHVKEKRKCKKSKSTRIIRRAPLFCLFCRELFFSSREFIVEMGFEIFITWFSNNFMCADTPSLPSEQGGNSKWSGILKYTSEWSKIEKSISDRNMERIAWEENVQDSITSIEEDMETVKNPESIELMNGQKVRLQEMLVNNEILWTKWRCAKIQDLNDLNKSRMEELLE